MRPVLESWLLEAASTGLAAWKRALLKLALSLDKDLRGLAVELAIFTRDEDPRPLLAPEPFQALAARLKAAAHQRLSDEKLGLVRAERVRRSVRPGFALATAASVAVLVLAYLVIQPSRGGLKTDQAQSAMKAGLPAPIPPTPLPAEPSTTSTPPPTVTATPQAAPVPASPSAK